MEPDLFIPGDEQYQMVNEPLEPMGIQTLIPENKIDFRKMAIDAAKNKAINYTAGKLGVNQTLASGVAGLLGLGSNTFAPLAFASALTGRSLGISDYLANKRAQKQYAQSENMLEAKVLSNQLANQGSARDDAMVGGNIPSKTSAPAARQSRQTSGIGGLHSGY